MANAAEKGGPIAPPKPPSPAIVGHPGSQRRITPKRRTPTARVTRTPTHHHNSSNNNQRNNYQRQSYQRRATSTPSRPQATSKKTPVAPPPVTKVIKPVAPPKPPNIASSLRSDTTYQQQMAAYAKSLADFQAEQGLSRGDYEKNYQGTRRDIGLAKQQASTDMENDYASRGLLRSSLYNTDVGKLNQQYQNQYNDLDTQRTNFISQLAQQLGSYGNEQKVQQQNALNEALRRRAEKYNL